MRHNLGYFFKEGWKNMGNHGFMTFAAIGVTVACLIIMGTFTLVALNININLRQLQAENAVIAFVDENLADSEAISLKSSIEAIDNVDSATFVSREEARDNYVAQYDENNLYSDISPKVFRHRFVIYLKDQTIMDETASEILSISGIAKVRADEAITTGFNTLSNIASMISITLIAVLVVVSLFIISNTIKLTTFDRREEIGIMRMVGATNAFIRWPFVFEGLLIGLLSGIISFGLQWLLYYSMQNAIAANDTINLLSIVDFTSIWTYVAATFTLTGILIGICGSLLAIRRFLNV